ncbi:MAG: hypothetical protein K1X83_03730 [Oligoflexia bacterium]|nr:hypothetical protein [Oligoflexia bacterium]
MVARLLSGVLLIGAQLLLMDPATAQSPNLIPAPNREPAPWDDIKLESQECPETDGDGINDCAEREAFNTDPTKADTDGDGLGDYEELFKYHTDAGLLDTDHDGLSDAAEVSTKSNPLGGGVADSKMLAGWDRYPTQSGGPEILDLKVAVREGIAEVSWRTDRDADGIVNFGLSPAYGAYKSDFAFTRSHRISFPIDQSRRNWFIVRACTPRPDSRCTSSDDESFAVR